MSETISTPVTVKAKLKNIVENTIGAIQYLKIFSDFIVQCETWRETLTPIKADFHAFLISRGRDAASFNNVVQYGALFLATSTDFLRSEHVKENVALTEAEKKEMQAELADAFSDPEARARLMKFSAAVGWALQDIMMPYADHEECERVLKIKLESIQQNILNRTLVDGLLHSMTTIEKGLLLAERLEGSGLEVMSDDTVKPKDEQAAKLWEELQQKTYPTRAEGVFSDEHGDVDKIPEEFTALQTPIAKLILECTNVVRL